MITFGVTILPDPRKAASGPETAQVRIRDYQYVPGDLGHVTRLSADRALYEGRRGGSFYLDRTDTPPPWPRCA